MAKGFLDMLAEKAYKADPKYFPSTCCVFASKRAGLFFQYALSKRIRKTCFAPITTTIQEFSEIQSGLTKADDLTLTGMLYATMKQWFIEQNRAFEPENATLYLDQCAKILTDYNDIDNALVPREQIFHNIKGLDELSTLDYLTDEQRKTIESFWGHIDNNKKQKHNYLSFLEMMDKLLPRYCSILANKCIGYDGMVVRTASEAKTDDIRERFRKKFPNVTRFVFAGLYALTPAQKKMLHRFKEETEYEVQFYWEEVPTLFSEENNPEGFIGSEIKRVTRENKDFFGGEVLSSPNSAEKPQIEVLSVSSATARYMLAKDLSDQIKKMDTEAVTDLKTAIICPDENELTPLLRALASEGQLLNVTMGVPLSQANISSWIYYYLQLLERSRRKEGYIVYMAEQLQSLLLHPLSQTYIGSELCEEILSKFKYPYMQVTPQSLFQNMDEPPLPSNSFVTLLNNPPLTADKLIEALVALVDTYGESLIPDESEEEEEQKDTNELTQHREIESEFAYQYRKVLIRIKDMLPLIGHDIPISLAVKLILKLTESAKVGFEGEPLEGLQVMGFLESRLLQFYYLIIVNANEGILPRRMPHGSSFIPYSLREAYGLATYRTREKIEAYHFYRLIGTAQRCYLLVEDNADSEPSRYIKQIRYLTDLSLKESFVPLPSASVPNKNIVIQRTSEINNKLNAYLTNNGGKCLSASALNKWVRCPLRFYLHYVEGIEDTLESDDIVTPIDFGLIVHQTMEQLYEGYKSKMLMPNDLNKMLSEDGDLTKKVENKYREIVFGTNSKVNELKGIHRIYADAALQYVRAILQHDATYTDGLYIVDLEKKFTFNYEFSGKTVSFNFIIDRLDRIGGRNGPLRIIDYKTGADDTSFTKWENVWKARGAEGISQLFLYSLGIATEQPYGAEEAIRPALYLLPEMRKDPENYDAVLSSGSGKKKEKIENFLSSDYNESFQKRLVAVLNEMFDASAPITQTTDSFNACTFCPFADYCGRKS